MKHCVPHALVWLVISTAVVASAQTLDAPVRIGVAAPLTGAIAHLGKDMENGARLAIEDLNAQKLVIGGRQVRFEAVVEDDRADPATATNVAQKLADMQVNGIVGHLNSGTTIPAARVYNNAGIPQVAPAATNPQYTRAGYRYAARLMATDVQQANGIASYISRTLQAKTVAVIDDRTAYGQGLADEVVANLGKLQVNVLKREFGTDRATDFSAILTTLRGLKPDVIVYAGADAQAALVNRQMKQLGVNARFIAGDGVCTGEWSKLAAGANEGAYCTQAGAPRDAMGAFEAFNQRFRARFGAEVIVFAPYAYDAVMVLVEAMKRAGSTDPAAYGPKLPGVTVTGVIGPIAFDARGDNLHGSVTIYQIRGGKLVVAQ
ncbi:Leucine-, isoleucine-, valine-, threonine-, and alanine-binding protein precursor [Variovorax sp. PBS-H4]|uniref:branched-chain amino acid ABC transporter substrate-binding protein n=1 Tax=Variovorax sp. PBS-H4 TaxID=434008 RepID=UPI001315F068|nr:branched-chain amino acid ABC transporter substrate-binding protein [Variovorax sp. PBS-H4]VTU28134.1 Leucine-, isoleucine-, valine-, threonine-, and alanine-binding protein precursor [Variovorax sp. PBS-H4]